MVVDNGKQQPVVIEEITDPVELAASRARWERFDRNWKWFEAHATEIYRTHRGKILCIAGEELFVGDDVREVVAQALAAHPEEIGWFTRIIPKERLERIYAH